VEDGQLVYLNIKSISFFDVTYGLPPQLECSVSPGASPVRSWPPQRSSPRGSPPRWWGSHTLGRRSTTRRNMGERASRVAVRGTVVGEKPGLARKE
jgi:hypothetical protein